MNVMSACGRPGRFAGSVSILSLPRAHPRLVRAARPRRSLRLVSGDSRFQRDSVLF